MSILYTPRTWVAAEIVTATEMNTEVRDPFIGLQAAWTSYTPALTATTTNPTLGSGNSVQGAWLQMGKSITGSADIVFGTSGVAAGSGSYGISLPTAAVASSTTVGRVVGSGVFLDSSSGNLYPMAVIVSATATVARMVCVTALLGSAAPVVPAASDRINIEFDYQAA